ncbi:MAG: hypothetical protein ISR96_05685 [Nitrospira sp.]|nr:hypothetical protein [bacterium]MBL7048990.1 hypothetical protein [Nitrospira sp.]
MDELEKKLKAFFRTKHNHGIDNTDSHCLSEETMAGYIEGSLPDDNKLAAESHLADCSGCLEKSIIYRRVFTEAEKAAMTSAPSSIAERTKKAFREKTCELAAIAVSFTRDIVSILSDSAGICTVFHPEAIPQRGGRMGLSDAVLIKHNIGIIPTEITIEQTSIGRFDILLSCRQPSGIRVSLFEKNRELRCSALAEKLFLEDLPPADYELAFSKDGERIGGLQLRIISD